MPFSPSLAASTIIVSYVIWGTGVPLALIITAMWLQRTIIHGAPAAAALPSTFLPLGPCGQGSFGIILLGRTVRELAYSHNTGLTVSATSIVVTPLTAVADAIYAGGLVTGLILWGLGLCWYILAFAMIIHHASQRSHRDFFSPAKFSVGFWAFTFPIGVFATATNILAVELDSPAFRVIGAYLSAQVVLHWVYVSVMTTITVLDGSLFVAPEMAQFEGGPRRRFGRVSREDEEHCC
jgi:tellurite resistance protein TehA-like permease